MSLLIHSSVPVAPHVPAPWPRALMHHFVFLVNLLNLPAFPGWGIICRMLWRRPWAEEPGRLQSIGPRGVGHDRVSAHARWIAILLLPSPDTSICCEPQDSGLQPRARGDLLVLLPGPHGGVWAPAGTAALLPRPAARALPPQKPPGPPAWLHQPLVWTSCWVSALSSPIPREPWLCFLSKHIWTHQTAWPKHLPPESEGDSSPFVITPNCLQPQGLSPLGSGFKDIQVVSSGRLWALWSRWRQEEVGAEAPEWNKRTEANLRSPVSLGNGQTPTGEGEVTWQVPSEPLGLTASRVSCYRLSPRRAISLLTGFSWRPESLLCQKKAMAPHSGTLAWKNPMDGGAW